jgi:hypothetical protein
MNEGITYDVRVYRTEVYKGVTVTTYRVRWKAGKRLWREGFRTTAQADSFRSALLTAARKGEAFSLATGKPTAWERKKADTTWYEFARAYVDMKWKQASTKYRKDIARALTAATPAMLLAGLGRPEDASIRRALVRWGFNTKQRAEPPDDIAEVLAWVGRNSTAVSALAEAATARRVLEQATGRLDGKNAAASTARRNRTILANAMDYAVKLGLLDTNPVRALKWTAPKVSGQVDRRSVVNPRQARALLDAVRAQQPSGPAASAAPRTWPRGSTAGLALLVIAAWLPDGQLLLPRRCRERGRTRRPLRSARRPRPAGSARWRARRGSR